MQIVLKNGLVYRAIRSFNCFNNKWGESYENYLDTNTNTIRIENEYGRQTFVFPNEVDWEATKKLQEENNAKTQNH